MEAYSDSQHMQVERRRLSKWVSEWNTREEWGMDGWREEDEEGEGERWGGMDAGDIEQRLDNAGWGEKTMKIVKVGGMRSEVGTEQKKHSSAY